MKEKKTPCISADKYNLLKNTFDKIPSLICVVDEEHKLKMANESFSEFFGLKSLKNLCIAKVVHKALGKHKMPKGCLNTIEDPCHINQAISKLIKSKDKSIDYTLHQVLKSKNKSETRQCLKVTISNLDAENENLYLICFEDLTEIEQINQEKNTFIGIAAHDLRNPITIIKGMSELLMIRNKQLDPTDHNLLTRINQNASYMTKLVNNLLDISHIESGKLVLEKKTYNFSKFIEEIIDDNVITAESKKIKLKLTDTTDKQNELVFDTTYVEEAINNLLGNAFKFSSKGQHIEVNVTEDEKSIITQVKDHGPGIKKSDQKKLFGLFQKTDNKPKTNEKSTGLGLAIVKKIALAHDGQIWIDSKKGLYTSVFFSLPKNSASA